MTKQSDYVEKKLAETLTPNDLHTATLYFQSGVWGRVEHEIIVDDKGRILAVKSTKFAPVEGELHDTAG